MRRWLAFVTAAGILCAPSRGHADESRDLWTWAPPAPEPEPPPAKKPPRRPPPTTVWYGEKLLIPDALALSLMWVGLQEHSDTRVFYLGLGTYLFGGAGVHLAEGEGGAAAASVGVRLGAPILGGALGAPACTNGDGGCLALVALGVIGGLAAALTIDYSVLAYKDAPKRKARTLVPHVSLAAGRGEIGLAGQF